MPIRTIEVTLFASWLAGELSVIEAYRQVLEELGERVPEAEDLNALWHSHLDTVDQFWRYIERIGSKPPTNNCQWNASSKVLEVTTVPFDRNRRLKALRTSEEHILREYETAVEEKDLPVEVGSLLRGLITRQRENIRTLGRMMGDSSTSSRMNDTEREARLTLSEEELAVGLKRVGLSTAQSDSAAPSTETVILEALVGEVGPLTPAVLGSRVAPFLAAIGELQAVIDEIQSRPRKEVGITSIAQNSPISVDLRGATEAIGIVRDSLVPWRRKHAETMARLDILTKQGELESKKAEILEKKAHVTKEYAEAAKFLAEAAKQREEARRLRLENDKLALEIYRAKIQLAIDILGQLAPGLSEADRIGYTLKLLPSLEVLIDNELAITEPVVEQGR